MAGAVKVPIGELPFLVLYDKHNYSKTWRAACDFIIDYFLCFFNSLTSHSINVMRV